MESYELPDNGQNELFISIMDIVVADSDQLDFQFTGTVETGLAVAESVEDILRLQHNLVPFNDLIIDSVDDLAQDDTVGQAIVQVINEDAINVK